MEKSNESIKRTLIIVLILSLLAGMLILINRDLLHFEYRYPFVRTFSPEIDPKGNYVITDSVSLKKGTYQLSFNSSSERKGSGCFIKDSNENILYSSDIPQGSITDVYLFEIEKPASIRVGYSYTPNSGMLETRDIVIKSDHVLYKDSLIRHAVISLFVIIVFLWFIFRFAKPDFPEYIHNKTGLNYAYLEKVFLFLLVLTILASWPLFDSNKFPEGDDFYFHLSRVEGISSTLKAGYIPPRILLNWMLDYGVGSEFYYPNLFFLFTAVLRLFGFSAVTALKVFFFLCTYFSLLTIYLAGKNIGKGRDFCGIFASLLYAFASYRLICTFYRNAVGEIQAFIFYPLIVWGLYEILRGHTKRWKIFAFGFFGMLMSHMISLAIAGVLCAMQLLFSLRQITKNRSILISLVKATAITLLLGAFFLFPMIEQTLKTELLINSYIEGNYLNWDGIYESNLSRFLYLLLPFDPWRTEDKTWIGPHPGWVLLAIPLLRVFLSLQRKTDKEMQTADRFMIISLLLMLISTDFFPWHLVHSIFVRIQFSWRLLSPATVLMCLAGGIYLNFLYISFQNKKLILISIFCAAVLSGMPILIYTFTARMVPVSELNLTNKIITPEEYKPRTLSRTFVVQNQDRTLADSNRSIITEYKRDKLGYVFSFERITPEDSAVYSVPLVYYYGYIAELTDAQGKVHKIPVLRDDIGLVQVNDEGTQEGTFRIHYEKTKVQIASEICSLATLLFVIYRSVRKKGFSKENIDY